MKVLLAFATLLEVLGLDVGIARLLTTFLLDLPNSRKQELEGALVYQCITSNVDRSCLADVIGLRLSAKACYDPDAAPVSVFFSVETFQLPHCLCRMFTRMGQLEKAQGKRLNVDFLYTHPTSENRVKVLSEHP